MRNEHAATSAPTAGSLERVTDLAERRRVQLAAGVLALVAAGTPFLARLLLNARVGVAAGLATWMHELGTLAVAGPALAAGALAATTDDELERAALAFVTAFGLVAAVSPAATVPAAGAIVGGGGLAAYRRIETRRPGAPTWRLAPVALLTAGVAASLFAAMGVAAGLLRPTGSHLALLGAAATPALLAHGRTDWALGGVIAGLLVAVGVAAPFVTGAVALVGGGVVATNLLVMAAGLCGLVTTASAAVRTRHWLALLGAGLLLVAGVPGTVPRALAAVLGVLLLIEPRGEVLSG